ncbi:hypothetical protein M438DRAFT_87816 [Aureobasidium pullulans EXF-150]|uniref:Uncharacterized protein n=1 Tax=Aureobasidium pullulans EXF-150 TaxID=1043002 RepID=A0A074YP22_AURPU|nr:uncharacterized protein M438DRAFT_87816 [Aureobasidium pullulans EXF-150]KEQ88591.1 hypothetical protein M438DRAFT_87816 [Aureobasidium pullulans EXF-150]
MAIGSWSYQRPAMRRDVSMKELPTVDTNTIARFSSSLVFHLRIKVLPGFPVPTACAGFQLRENMLFFSRKLNVEKAPKLWSKTTQMHLSNHILTVPWLVHEISSRCAPSSRLVGNGDRMTRSAARSALWPPCGHQNRTCACPETISVVYSSTIKCLFILYDRRNAKLVSHQYSLLPQDPERAHFLRETLTSKAQK